MSCSILFFYCFLFVLAAIWSGASPVKAEAGGEANKQMGLYFGGYTGTALDRKAQHHWVAPDAAQSGDLDTTGEDFRES